MQNLDMILLTVVLSGIFIFTICLYVSFIKTVYECRLKQKVCTENVEAKVIKCKELWMKGGKTAYIPTYEYEYNGKIYTYKAKIERYFNNIEYETKIILINPDNPQTVHEDGSSIYTPLMIVCASIPTCGILYIVGYIIKYLFLGL